MADERGHHFTYRSDPGPDLYQGDVIRQTPEVVMLLRRTHPQFTARAYTHFIVLTQSCDLVRRKREECKTEYVTLAPMRPLMRVLQERIEVVQEEFDRVAGVADQSKRAGIRQFVERLLNNNEPEHFYLHEDSTFGFPVSSCALLRQCLSFRSTESYVSFYDARVLSLTEGFQAKLGWMVGNLYSRVGTEDWVPGACRNSKEFDRHVKLLLDAACTWVDPEQLALARRTNSLPLNSSKQPALVKHVQSTQVGNNRERAIESVQRVLRDLGVGSEDQLKRLARNLHSDPDFKASVPAKRSGGPDG